MCGVASIIAPRREGLWVREALERADAVQRHRGPDDHGMLVEEHGEHVVGLGHQRLSIIDLSPAGHQPMVSPSGRFAIAFNGEIYNYREIADRLNGDPELQNSASDTAVALAALARWGPEAFRAFNGMWAIVFLDRRSRRLIVSRDRLGVKPLHWCRRDGALLLASEAKAMLAMTGGTARVDAASAFRFLSQATTDADERTFLEGVSSVPAGTYAEIEIGGEDAPRLAFTKFWKHPYQNGEAADLRPPDPAELRSLLVDSVRLRLRADVPVGVLLSGGIDSSAILGAAAALGSAHSLRTYAAVSDDPESSEEPYIDLMSSAADCPVHKFRTSDDPLLMFSELGPCCWANDQPVLGFSAVAYRRLIATAREDGLHVLLSGQGADEQLAGYNKFLYFQAYQLFRRGSWLESAGLLAGFVARGTVLREFRLEEARRYMPLARRRTEFWGPRIRDAEPLEVRAGADYRRREWLDITSLSIPMLLHYEDRMSMSHGSEVRVPFLDYRIVEWLGRVSPEWKLRAGWSKWILRKAIEGLVPDRIRWRKDKRGFNLPERSWLRGPCVPVVRRMLAEGLLSADLGFVDASRLSAAFEEFVQKDSGISYKQLFAVISFESWLREVARRAPGGVS
jgi:asparagine synthase (glutamine-hydrolysing)